MTDKTTVNKNDQENKETTTANESNDPKSEKRPMMANGGTDGVQLSNVATVSQVADDEQRDKEAMESVAALSATQVKTDPSFPASGRKIRRYSNGISFKRRCTVKQIPCDQLNALACGKCRISQDDEHRNWVLRRIFTLGGWVRTIDVGYDTVTVASGGETFSYVPPNTPIPDSIQSTNQEGKSSRRKNKKASIFSNVKFWNRNRNDEQSVSVKRARSC